MKQIGGFTLAEMAIVLVIVTLLIGGMLIPLGTQIEQRRISETQKTLELANDALLGFAAANGRLPCPASAISNGLESFCSNAGGACVASINPADHGRCSNFFDGFLPAATLGISPVDSQGYALDGWGISPSNRIRYAVSDKTVGGIDFVLTAKGGMRAATMANLSSAANFLYVCASAAGNTINSCGISTALTSRAPAVIYSVGGNAATGGAGADETANPNPNGGSADLLFVSHPKSGAVGNEFDDIVTWMSLNILFNRMIAAGQLP